MGEFCHNRNGPTGEWCGKPAEFIVWGKLFPPDVLGPRCYDCAVEHIDSRTLGDKSAAIFHLSQLTAAQERIAELEAIVEKGTTLADSVEYWRHLWPARLLDDLAAYREAVGGE